MHKVFAAVISASLALFALTGCGPKFTGTLNEGGSGSPVPPANAPQINSLNPSNAAAGSSSFTLTVNGSNFVSSTDVIWDNTTLATTFISSTVLQAQVPSSLIAKPGTVSVIVSPVVTLNFGSTFTITVPPLSGNSSYSVSMTPVQANDMAWDPVNQQIYLSVASGNATDPNTITALIPQTGQLGTSGPAASEPGRLAVSSDGSYLYAGLNGAASVRRFTLPNLQPDIDIPIGGYYAIDVETAPGSPHSVAVVQGLKGVSPKEQGGIVIYDDAVARPESVPGFPPTGPIDSIVWNPNGQSLYGIDTEGSGTGLYIMSVGPAGVLLEKDAQSAGSYFGNNLHFDSTTGYLYSDIGEVIDPANDTVIGTFPFDTIQGGFISDPVMVPDGKLNIAYFLGQTAYATEANTYVIEAFDLTHFTFLGAVPVGIVPGTPAKMIRWGTNGLAFLTTDPYGAGAPGDGVYLISGGFVTSPAPQ